MNGRLIGYCENRKGWEFWVLERKQVVVWYEVARWDEDRMGNKGVVGGDRDYEGWMVELDEGREWYREGRDKPVAREGGMETVEHD